MLGFYLLCQTNVSQAVLSHYYVVCFTTQLQIREKKEGNLRRHFKECFYLLKELSIVLSVCL